MTTRKRNVATVANETTPPPFPADQPDPIEQANALPDWAWGKDGKPADPLYGQETS